MLWRIRNSSQAGRAYTCAILASASRPLVMTVSAAFEVSNDVE